MEFNINKLIDHSFIDSSLLIDELMNCGVAYSSLTLLDEKGQSYFSKSSSDKWHLTYIESGLYKKCHLMIEASKQVAFHQNGFLFVWDNYFPTNEESQYLDQMRHEQNIAHGVAFCSPLQNGGKSILTVTGRSSDIYFTQGVMKNKQAIYKAVIRAAFHSAV